MTAHDFLQYVRGVEIPQHLRRGQFAFNHLLEVRPDLAERVRGTEPDPFGLHYLSSAFEEWIISAWGNS